MKRKKIERILFISPPLLSEKADFYPDFPSPPLGLGYICANAGDEYEKQILDFSFYENWQDVHHTLDQVAEFDLYAFTSMSPNYENAVRVGRYLKERYPESLFLIGGSQPTITPDKPIKSGVFDLTVRGEGEFVLQNLLKTMNNGGDLKTVPGISYRDDSGEIIITEKSGRIMDLDLLKYPARELMNMDEYIDCFQRIVNGERGTTVITSRGCSFDCSFCAKEIFGRSMKWRSAENVVAEIKDLVEKYHLDTIHFVDDMFTGNHLFLRRFAALLKSNHLNINWQCESRIDCVNEEILGLMRDCGCKAIMYGVESGEQRILDNMKKQLKVEQILKTCEATHRAGIDVGAFLILGYYGETKESLMKTLDVIRKIKPTIIAVSFATMLPGTQLFNEMAGDVNSNKINFNDYHIRSNLELRTIDFNSLLEAREEIFEMVRQNLNEKYGSRGLEK